MPALRAQKSMQCWRFSPFPGSYGPETYQGVLVRVLVDSLGVSAIKIGRIFAPDCRQCRQEALWRVLATLGAFLCCFAGFWQRGQRWGNMRDLRQHGSTFLCSHVHGMGVLGGTQLARVSGWLFFARRECVSCRLVAFCRQSCRE